MLTHIFILVAGLIVLIFGGEVLVRGASSIALRARISPMVVGLTIVAFGTSAPELLISINSAISGSPDMAMGNVVGSNICNLGLVLGITSLIYPIQVKPNFLKIDWPVTMGSSILLYVILLEGIINWMEGISFVLLLIIFIVYTIRKSRRENSAIRALATELDVPEEASNSIPKDLLLLMAGCIGLYYGSEWFVDSAKDIAIKLGVSERIIGITVLAIGTSLPELVTSTVAAYKKETDLALGNLLGSNIFNILSILGITSIIKNIELAPGTFDTDLFWMLGITGIVFPMMYIQKDINRYEGFVLVALYICYTFFVIS